MRRYHPLILVVASLVMAAPASHALSISEPVLIQEEGPGRGDDLARMRQWRSFLDRAFRAFTAAKMSTTAVKAKIEEADERIAELQGDPEKENTGRTDITGDVAFLERALRAFTAAKMSTTDVKRWLEEARESSGAA